MFYPTEIPANTNLNTSDIKSRVFIESWLSMRKNVLSKNIQNYNNHMNNGLTNTEESTNAVLFNQIGNMNKAKMSSDDYLPAGVYGKYNKKTKEIGISNKLIRSKNIPLLEDFTTHERTHSLRPIPQELTIKKLLDNSKFNKSSADNYLDSSEEIYARLMSFRKKVGLNPNDIITNDHIKQWSSPLKEFDLHRYPSDFLLNLFNGVASNTKQPSMLHKNNTNKLITNHIT